MRIVALLTHKPQQFTVLFPLTIPSPPTTVRIFVTKFTLKGREHIHQAEFVVRQHFLNSRAAVACSRPITRNGLGILQMTTSLKIVNFMFSSAQWVPTKNRDSPRMSGSLWTTRDINFITNTAKRLSAFTVIVSCRLGSYVRWESVSLDYSTDTSSFDVASWGVVVRSELTGISRPIGRAGEPTNNHLTIYSWLLAHH